jgi:hypothetical protein
MAKPTPADLLAQARQLTAALKDYAPEDLVAEGMAILNGEDFQGYVVSLEAICKVLPEDNRFKGVFNNLATSVRAANALVNQEKMTAAVAAAQAANAAENKK